MRALRRTLVLGAAGALMVTLAPAGTAAAHGGGKDLGREVLGANDGWAAAEGGTTGGSAAAPANAVHVDTWEEFRAALGGEQARGDTTPRIVYVHGVGRCGRRSAGGAARGGGPAVVGTQHLPAEVVAAGAGGSGGERDGQGADRGQGQCAA